MLDSIGQEWHHFRQIRAQRLQAALFDQSITSLGDDIAHLPDIVTIEHHHEMSAPDARRGLARISPNGAADGTTAGLEEAQSVGAQTRTAS
jgi:hypothetical protein